MKTFWLETKDALSRRISSELGHPCDTLGRHVSCDLFAMDAPESPDHVNKEKIAHLSVPLPPREMMQTKRKDMWGESEVFDAMPSQPTLRRGTSDSTSRLIDWNVDVSKL
jgi:hypothetical protein